MTRNGSLESECPKISACSKANLLADIVSSRPLILPVPTMKLPQTWPLHRPSRLIRVWMSRSSIHTPYRLISAPHLHIHLSLSGGRFVSLARTFWRIRNPFRHARGLPSQLLFHSLRLRNSRHRLESSHHSSGSMHICREKRLFSP